MFQREALKLYMEEQVEKGEKRAEEQARLAKEIIFITKNDIINNSK